VKCAQISRGIYIRDGRSRTVSVTGRGIYRRDFR
jgi:hypothetical protein